MTNLMQNTLSSQSPLLVSLQLLVVENDPDNRELLVFVLEAEGSKVTAVGTAQAALEVLEHVQLDAMVCELALPDKDGYCLLQQWRSREAELGFAPIPAIAVTSLVGRRNGHRALAAGFQLYLPKPFDVVQLPQTIVTTLARSSISCTQEIA